MPVSFPPPGLSARLRAATRSRHDAVEAVPFFVAMRRDDLPRQCAVSYLRGLTIVHAVLESCLSSASAGLPILQRAQARRSASLRATLEAADTAGLPDIPRAIDAAIRLADRILLAAHQPEALLGPLYVLEGSQLGGQILRRHLATALDIAPERISYIAEPKTVAAEWASLRRDLDGLELPEQAVEAVLRAAEATFEGIAELAASAYPYVEDELRHRVTAINPEAGDHAMPQSETEIALALRCAEAAWNEFPYLEVRYGERGRRFTSSDSCWLVSLRELDEADLLRALSWLRDLLAARGLPSLILEGHLDTIADDLRLCPPQGSAAHGAFEAVSARFREERAQVLPAAIQRELVERWEPLLAACDGPIVPGAATIVVAAKLDAARGVPRAWEGTFPWFRDAARFSASWIAAIDGLAGDLDRLL